ncbi:hypothetical protein Fmac_017331 [Flemingia macrophylla]|uniref:Uncharacterized protein n=1 Tax=Flemingia macrophylla TaxID=520843 RepID=A0ABD1M3P8_9FABA
MLRRVVSCGLCLARLNSSPSNSLNKTLPYYAFCTLTSTQMNPTKKLTFSHIFQKCSNVKALNPGKQAHAQMFVTGFEPTIYVSTCLLQLYGKSSNMDYAFKVFGRTPQRDVISWNTMIFGYSGIGNMGFAQSLFDSMPERDVVFWNSLLSCYLNNGANRKSVEIFVKMRSLKIPHDYATFVVVLKACSGIEDYGLGLQVHCLAIHMGFENNVVTGSALVDMYQNNDRFIEGLKLFNDMLKVGMGVSQSTYASVFRSCAGLSAFKVGTQLHGLALKSDFGYDSIVGTVTLDIMPNVTECLMPGKQDQGLKALEVFRSLQKSYLGIDEISLSGALIASHEQNEEIEETLSLFISMLRSTMEPDNFPYGSVVKTCASQQALNYGMEIHGRIIKSGMGLTGLLSVPLLILLDICANMATVELGKQIHAQVLKLQLHSDVYIASTLVDMYSKCGNMQDSRLMFEKAPKRDYVTWSAMICAYAYHGLAEEAIQLFEEMQLLNVKPNHTIFISVLGACAHLGYVDRGLHYFQKMQSQYGLDPHMEHYSCMVDLLGRSGQVNEALKLIESLPFEADDVIWRTLLGNRRMQGNVEVAEKAINFLLQLDPQDSSAYVLLSNVYANAGMWGEVAKIISIMKNSKLKKEPGCSWIEVRDEVQKFLVGDKAHPRAEEIYEHTHLLVDEMKWVGYVPDIDFMLDEEVEEQDPYEGLKITVCSVR